MYVLTDIASKLKLLQCSNKKLTWSFVQVDIPPPKPFPPILYILEQEDLRAPIPPPEFGYPNEVTGGYQGTKGDEKVGLSTTRPLIPRTHLFGV